MLVRLLSILDQNEREHHLHNKVLTVWDSEEVVAIDAVSM